MLGQDRNRWKSDLAILSHTVCSTISGACVSANGSRTRLNASETFRKSAVMDISSSSSAGTSMPRPLLEGADTCERGIR